MGRREPRRNKTRIVPGHHKKHTQDPHWSPIQKPFRFSGMGQGQTPPPSETSRTPNPKKMKKEKILLCMFLPAFFKKKLPKRDFWAFSSLESLFALGGVQPITPPLPSSLNTLGDEWADESCLCLQSAAGAPDQRPAVPLGSPITQCPWRKPGGYRKELMERECPETKAFF